MRENLGTNDFENKAVAMISAELFFQSDCGLGEGPVWEAGTLYWTDITGKAIYTRRDDGSVTEKFAMPFEVGSFVLWKDHSLVLATEYGFQSFNLRTRKTAPLSNPEKNLLNNRFNDGKCDPKGRFVAGTLSRIRQPEAALYLFDHDQSVRQLFYPVTNSNGLAWTESGEIFYYIDTASRAVRAFDYDLENGALSNERVVIKIPESHGKPDGMTIDRNGNLWIALWEGWGIECWNPQTGKQIARIEVPVARVTSCTFGGLHYETLLITTARQGLDSAALAQQEFAGSIFRARPGASGYPAVHFRSDSKI